MVMVSNGLTYNHTDVMSHHYPVILIDNDCNAIIHIWLSEERDYRDGEMIEVREEGLQSGDRGA